MRDSAFPDIFLLCLLGQFPSLISRFIWHRYCWSALNSFLSTSGKSLPIHWNRSTGLDSQVNKREPIGPESKFGFFDLPSKSWRRRWSGNSLSWSIHISYWIGFSIRSSINKITSPFPPVLIFVPSQPIALMHFRFLLSEPLSKKLCCWLY